MASAEAELSLLSKMAISFLLLNEFLSSLSMIAWVVGGLLRKLPSLHHASSASITAAVSLLQKFTWNYCTTTYKKFTKSAETFVVPDFTNFSWCWIITKLIFLTRHTKGDEYNAEAAEVLTMSDASTRKFCALAARENRKNSIFQDAMQHVENFTVDYFVLRADFFFIRKERFGMARERRRRKINIWIASSDFRKL